jgi:hypothetical protein
VPPDWFWAATPVELALEIDAQTEIANGDRARLWVQAALIRSKKLPAIETFAKLPKTKPRKQTWQEMQAYMRQFKGPPDASDPHRPKGSGPGH